MSKEKLAAAKQFIQEKQYREARIILESTDHPKANEWLAKLPKPDQSQKIKNTPRRNSINSPAFIFIAIFVLLVTFVSGAFVGQIIATYEPPIGNLDVTRTAIHNVNSTTEALIKATIAMSTEFAEQTQAVATQQLSPLDLTRTAIANSNATTEVLIHATQTADALD